MVPARMFNRLYAVSGIVFSFIAGAVRHDQMLNQLGYRAMGDVMDS